jgi:hypothetical protein
VQQNWTTGLLIASLLSPEAEQLTGALLPVDGGLTRM